MSDLLREPDEMWTSYLIRRLEAEGMHFPRALTSYSGENVVRFVISADISDLLNFEITREIGLDESTPLAEKRCTYTNSRSLGILLESVNLSMPPLDGQSRESIAFWFIGSDEAILKNQSREQFQDYFPDYEEEKQYRGQQVVDDVVTYALKFRSESGFPARTRREKRYNSETRISLSKKLGSPPLPSDQHLNEILQTVRRLEHIAAEHPLIMQGEYAYMRKLYVDTINRDANNLKVFEYKGQNIPYVLVDSDEIEGNVGKPCNNLYFVARDIAVEPWQQKIVALHESFCVKKGHRYAKRQEPKLAQELGKEKEYRQWRRSIDQKLK